MEKNINIIDTTDRISELPELILHHILSYLKSPVDLVRCSALSKEWFTLTASFPVLNFDLGYFNEYVRLSKSSHSTLFGAGKKMFYKYMDYTTSRFCMQNQSVHTFNLHVTLEETTEIDIIERCLGLVLTKGIKVLGIKAYPDMYCRSVPFPMCRLPLSSASSLTSLTVSRCELPIWSMVDVVKCLNNNSCPLLEELNVEYGSGLKTFCIYGLQKLQKVRVYHVDGLERLNIEAPNLRECHVSFEESGEPPSLNMESCKQLTTLRLNGCPFPTPKGFADFLSNFPLLENLFLSIPNHCNSLSLSNPSLRIVALHVSCDLGNIDISSRNLLYFKYLGYFYSSERDTTESKSRMYCLPGPGNDADTRWFQKLRLFLDKTNRFNDLILNTTVGSIDIEQLKRTQSLPYELEHVRLNLESPYRESSGYASAVEALLWCCRPRSLTLLSDILDVEKQSDLVKFTYEKLLQQEQQGEISIQFVLSSSSKVNMNFSDLNSLLTALPRHKPRHSIPIHTITFVKEEVVHEEGILKSRGYGDALI